MKSDRTTLSGISPQQILRLKELALQMTGELSVSSLIRLIANKGQVIDNNLIVPKDNKNGLD